MINQSIHLHLFAFHLNRHGLINVSFKPPLMPVVKQVKVMIKPAIKSQESILNAPYEALIVVMCEYSCCEVMGFIFVVVFNYYHFNESTISTVQFDIIDILYVY